MLIERIGKEARHIFRDEVSGSHRPQRQDGASLEQDLLRSLPQLHSKFRVPLGEGECDRPIVLGVRPAGSAVGRIAGEEGQKGRRIRIVGDPVAARDVVVDGALDIEETAPLKGLDRLVQTQLTLPR